ncbi:MAG TPA: GNAT family N-acetyltransferase [Selenomonadales bacterium]|nr:GNAT family N-acetyltransferase [Selenomonadales bacterium]
MGQPLTTTALYSTDLTDQITVDFAQTPKEREMVYRFRYQIYVEEMGKKLTNLPLLQHKRRQLFDELDDAQHAIILYARAGSEIVGTIRLNIFPPQNLFPQWLPDQFVSFFQADAPLISYSSKLMVDSRYRKSQAAYLLIAKGYELYRQNNVPFNFIGCAPFLIPLYEQMGFRRYSSNFEFPDFGCIVPLVLLTEDIGHLRAVRSPLMRVARKFDNSSKSSVWFAQNFPEAGEHINRLLLTKEQFHRAICDLLGDSPENALELLHGFTPEEAITCLNEGTIVNFTGGSLLVNPIDVSNELFFVLSGCLLSRKTWSKDRQTYTLLTPGQSFGGKSFLSMGRQRAKVVAQCDSKVLVLPRQAFDRLALLHPDIAAKLLRNIGVPASLQKKYSYA